MQENLVSQRNGRYVFPIKKEYRKQIKGSVVDESSSGQTVYVEPQELAVLQQELSILRIEEGKEEAKILSYLTELLDGKAEELRGNAETVGWYDYVFARGKYAQSIEGQPVRLNGNGVVDLRQAKHPLLGGGTVPLDIQIGRGYRALIVTGPNTGGKTVALKTVGLLCLMVQSGLLVPAGEGSSFPVFRHIAADIGDGQSLEQSLSTFSAHITRVIDMLTFADEATLVLIDEMASGTDPGEGVALSIALLEELARRGTMVIATTHYNEIKHFAGVTPGFRNARMEFDPETLRPLYRLCIGEAGSSYAFLISRKLGLNPELIRRAEELAARREEGPGCEWRRMRGRRRAMTPYCCKPAVPCWNRCPGRCLTRRRPTMIRRPLRLRMGQRRMRLERKRSRTVRWRLEIASTFRIWDGPESYMKQRMHGAMSG